VGLLTLRDITLVSTTPVDGATVLVRISSQHGLLDLTVSRRRVDAAGLTCAAPGPSWFLAHDPIAIDPVAGA
jgi:hypothetical protein